MRCKPGQDFLPYDRPIAVSKIGSTSNFYYENLGFDAASADARRLSEILDKLTMLLRDQKRPKIIGHEAIHLVLLLDTLLDDYTRSWEGPFATAFDSFRHSIAQGKVTRDDANPSEYWLKYGVGTRVNSDRADTIQRRHEFFAAKMHNLLQPQMKDPQRLFGDLERDLIYYRDRKRCGVCETEVAWDDAEVHHVQQHSQGGKTLLKNGALVHAHCHPKGAAATQEFAKKWRQQSATMASDRLVDSDGTGPSAEDEEGDHVL